MFHRQEWCRVGIYRLFVKVKLLLLILSVIFVLELKENHLTKDSLVGHASFILVDSLVVVTIVLCLGLFFSSILPLIIDIASKAIHIHTPYV